MNINVASDFKDDRSTIWGLGTKGSYISKKSEESVIKYVNDISKILADSKKPIFSRTYENIDPVVLFSDADFAKMNEVICYELNRFRRKLEEYAENGAGDYTGAMIPKIHSLHVFMHKHKSGMHLKHTKDYAKIKKENVKRIGTSTQNVGSVLLRRSSYENENHFKFEVLNSVISAITSIIIVREESGALLKAAISKKSDNQSKMLDALDEISISIKKTAALVEEFYHRMTLKSPVPLKRMVQYTPIIGYQNNKRARAFQKIQSMEVEEEVELTSQSN